MSAISIRGINKTYNKGKITALQSIDLDVAEGELFGLIGPDGAGKTTLFRILTTLLLPDSGEASVAGYNVLKEIKQIRNRVGYMPGKFSLYQDLTVEENLRFFATVFGTTIEENYKLIRDIYVQLEPFKLRRAGKLSGGMKQKLALCCALIHKPEVLFLDGPTTGVDAVSRKEFWGILKSLKKEGITIFVSTPYMDEANLCERIALIQGGSILSINTPQKITQSFGEPLYAIRSVDMPLLQKDLRALTTVKSCYSFGSVHHVTLSHDHPEAVFSALKNIHPKLEWSSIEPSIEDCFIKLM